MNKARATITYLDHGTDIWDYYKVCGTCLRLWYDDLPKELPKDEVPVP